ncbi:MAG: XRE family transcriptional regulator [Bdellovibrionales bacterium]|nr:XRE family transcriptional regulator [Bdellovibrionales bacterium]
MKKRQSDNLEFPSSADLRWARKKFSDPHFIGTRVLSKNATLVERAKYDICGFFINYMYDRKLAQKDLAKLLGIDASRANELVHYRYERFTLDRLLKLLEKLNPRASFKLVA